MSLFLVYFESKNAASTNYAGFSDVGAFDLPSGLAAGKIELTFEEKHYVGQLVSDLSRQSANDFFMKNGAALRRELFDFVEERVRNDCFVASLVGYVERHGNEGLAVMNLRVVTVEQLAGSFDREQFRNGHGLRIVQ